MIDKSEHDTEDNDYHTCKQQEKCNDCFHTVLCEQEFLYIDLITAIYRIDNTGVLFGIGA